MKTAILDGKVIHLQIAPNDRMTSFGIPIVLGNTRLGRHSGLQQVRRIGSISTKAERAEVQGRCEPPAFHVVMLRCPWVSRPCANARTL